MKFVARLFLFFWSVATILANSDDMGVRIVEQRQGDVIHLIAQSDHLLDFIVEIDASLENMQPSRPLPVVLHVKGQKLLELTTLRPRDGQRPSRYKLRYRWTYGARGGAPDVKAVYLLPYSPKERHELIQGYFGKFSHYAGSGNENAYDWAMPVGTTVCAARAGVVIGVRQDSDVGGPLPAYSHSANYVIIRHSDGTYAEYLHLQKNGVLVALGATVQAGQPIGLSGNTGFTSAPHLHFCVFRPLDVVRRETLPVAIQTKAGVLQRLTEGQKY